MDDPKSIHENGERRENLLNDVPHNPLESTHNDAFGRPDFLANMVRHAILLGTDKLLMAQKPGPSQALSNFKPQYENEPPTDHKEHGNFKNCKIQGKNGSKQKVCGLSFEANAIHAMSSSTGEYKIYNNNDDEFSLDFIAFVTLLVLKLATFQMRLLLRFFTFPIWFFNFSLMLMILPFQILTHLRRHLKKKLTRACHASFMSLFAVVSDRLKSQASVLRLAVRFGKAVICGASVFFVLVGLLVSGFVIGGIIMRNLVQESVHTTEDLNFDYTKTSPAAIVPVASCLVKGFLPSKLKLTVWLTLPESEYNRKLGVFQVRVETLSSDGKVIHTLSHPTMLRFKSQSIQVVETLFKSVPLITGLKSEVQTLKIMMGEFTELHGATSSFKVILEQRAEFQGGLGVPQIYGGTLEIESELPKLKRVLWNWRRTAFVWVSFGSFFGEAMFFLTFFRAVFIPGGGRSKAVGSSKKCLYGKIAWHKAIHRAI